VSKGNGFLQLRRGLWEHVRDGRMPTTEALTFIYICSEADTRTGIWKGSAKSLSGELGISERTARDVLEKMEDGDYIRRFAVPGRHACYPILVHKFPITQGEHNGEQLNAIESKSPVDLAYFPREQSVEDGVEHSVERGAAQRRSENREEKRRRNPAAKTAPPADPRFQPFFQFAYESFALKHGRKPLWQGKDRNGLKNLLRSQSAEALPLERLQTLLRNFLDSNEAFIVKQGDSLAYFCSNIDKFSDGPILTAPGKGKGIGKLDTNQAVAITMHGAAISARRVN
jgi:hypothetical protein